MFIIRNKPHYTDFRGDDIYIYIHLIIIYIYILLDSDVPVLWDVRLKKTADDDGWDFPICRLAFWGPGGGSNLAMITWP